MNEKSLPGDIKVLIVISLCLCFSSLLLVFDMSQPSICPKNETLGPSSRGIVEQYLNYDTEYLNKLDLGKDAMLKASGSSTNATYPVIVTATSSKCVSDMMIWIPEIAKLKLKTRVIVYDIGMTLLQRRKIHMLCGKHGFELKTFPFESYPSHIQENLSYDAWKPVLIQMSLLEFGFVMWMDATIRITSGNLYKAIRTTETHGIAIPYNNGLDITVPLNFLTSKLTFEAFNEYPCTFSQVYIFNAGLIVIQKTPFTQQYIMRPWVACALNKDCITGGSLVPRLCAGANAIGFCHKYDTSALSIILNRLFNSEELRNQIDLTGRISWIKCYVRKHLIVWDDAIFNDLQPYDQTYCRGLAVKYFEYS